MRYLCLLALCVSIYLWRTNGQTSAPSSRTTGRDPAKSGRTQATTQTDEHSSDLGNGPDQTIEPRRSPATVPLPGGVLRVGTWNVRRLGHGDKRLDLVAQVIEDSFDVVALQEVMTEQGVNDLLALLPGWSAEISPDPVGSGEYVEFYAVLYRSVHVAVERSFTVADNADALTREPFVTCMRAEAFDFCLSSVHIVFGDTIRARDEEIDALGQMLETLRVRDQEKDWIVLGDFNRMPGAPGWDALHDAGWDFSLAKRTATSLGKRAYSSPYDHILTDSRYTRELRAQAERVDLVAHACHGDFEMCRELVSDHAPVIAEFAVRGPDDD